MAKKSDFLLSWSDFLLFCKLEYCSLAFLSEFLCTCFIQSEHGEMEKYNFKPSQI